MEHTGLGIHIALTKYPLGYEYEYVQKMNLLYDEYKNKIIEFLNLNTASKEKIEGIFNCYQPAIYHLFSHFDLAFVSIVDNFKFPQRVFEVRNHDISKTENPKISETEKNNLKSVSYQILSGGIIKTINSPKPECILNQNKKFLKIILLKFNNGLLIGNGSVLFNNILSLIEDSLIKSGVKDYVFVNSYNWGELTIICLHEDPNYLAAALSRIRMLTLRDIEDSDIRETIKTNSLYKYWQAENIDNSHLLSESTSYLGGDFINYRDIDPHIPFYSNTEWQVKPGHFKQLAQELNSTSFKINKSYSNVVIKDGKTDFIIKENNQKFFSSNIELFNILRGNKNVHSHIRKVKTKPLYNFSKDIIDNLKKTDKHNLKRANNSEEFLRSYKITNGDEVDKNLKELNISRNTRKKVSKIIYNFNLGIQDPILYIYFIDLRKLLNQFTEELRLLSTESKEAITNGSLSSGHASNRYNSLKSTFIEKELIRVYIDVFQEAFDDRILNNYNYEDINEFSLDINSSLTGMISSLDSIIKFYASCFRNINANSIITTINDAETISNKLSVNYNIEHITNVPLIFATLIKEILNVQEVVNQIEILNGFSKLKDEFSIIIKDKSKSKQEFFSLPHC